MNDFKLSSLPEDKLNEISSSLDSNSVIGVIGVCGIVGNLVADKNKKYFDYPSKY